MKELQCNQCHKTVEVEDTYHFKTCPFCRIKYLKKYRLKQLDKKFLERHKIDKEKMPRALWSFSNFKEAWQWDKKPSYEDDYKPARLKWVQNHASELADKEISQRRMSLFERERYAKRFLRFDLFEPTNRTKCKLYRLTRLGVREQDAKFQFEHAEECDSCGNFWEYNLKVGTLTDRNGTPYVNPNQKLENLLNDCSKFRTMIRGSRQNRDTIFCDSHVLDCKSCAMWSVKRKQIFKGANLWQSGTEQQPTYSCPMCGSEVPRKDEVCQDCINELTKP